MKNLLRRWAAPLVAVTAAATIAVVGVRVPAADAAAIQFGYVKYNSPGTDTGTNANINGEYIRIKNTGTTRRSLTGWTVRDASGHVYRFGTFSLAPGGYVTLYSGKGTNTATKRYWGSRYYIWNNSGDKAVLKNAAGGVVDTCNWGSAGSGKYC